MGKKNFLCSKRLATKTRELKNEASSHFKYECCSSALLCLVTPLLQSTYLQQNDIELPACKADLPWLTDISLHILQSLSYIPIVCKLLKTGFSYLGITVFIGV